jgi:hypothetical protein
MLLGFAISSSSHELDLCDRDIERDFGPVGEFIESLPALLQSERAQVFAGDHAIHGTGIHKEETFPESLGPGRIPDSGGDLGDIH